jgi:transglutaminase/protease-like cytokinesis protein 3
LKKGQVLKMKKTLVMKMMAGLLSAALSVTGAVALNAHNTDDAVSVAEENVQVEKEDAYAAEGNTFLKRIEAELTSADVDDSITEDKAELDEETDESSEPGTETARNIETEKNTDTAKNADTAKSTETSKGTAAANTTETAKNTKTTQNTEKAASQSASDKTSSSTGTSSKTSTASAAVQSSDSSAAGSSGTGTSNSANASSTYEYAAATLPLIHDEPEQRSITTTSESVTCEVSVPPLAEETPAETPSVEETPAEEVKPAEQPKTAYYICSCCYTTTDKRDMAYHIIDAAKRGETHSYTTDYR